MARPKISEAELRSVNFTIRLTPGEQRELDDAAEVCGKTPAVIIRDKVFKGRFPKAKMPKLDMSTYLQIKKIGVNLNQLVRLAKAGKISVDLLRVILEVRRQQRTIIDKLFEDDSDSKDR
ncbi:MobC family plasmid mobilization relaxosome protein [Mucilaginibacter flavidus]|uniref:MobC family plasmid mobilization relaxosome protein n=1 Tax=Mucilaginibacter flavidus TaxID=2949309 RepID=UPI0020922856|nr:MobC family plasmid mobilization relaxosome protein [Mucilaginibacter flavidus]MCO5950468.1 MobC family plasmid mobilization relaxosome protein [Mucilaginibacter flavidus]